MDDRVVWRIGLDQSKIHRVPQTGDDIGDGIEVACPLLCEWSIHSAENLADQNEDGKQKVRDIREQPHV